MFRDFAHFPGAYAARLSFLTVAAPASSPESKPGEERTREKEISRERVPGVH